jgi:polyisoprenoid-binding protein YceI
MKTITAVELKALAGSATLIHVLPEEHFAQQHLPGAVNACVYEMIFLPKVAELVPDKSAAIIVYGAGVSLARFEHGGGKAGESGLHERVRFSRRIDGMAATGPRRRRHRSHRGDSINPDGIFEVDVETSVVRWTGRNLFNHHQGTVKLAGGRIEVQNGALKAASFTLDMNRIVCEDLVDTAYNALLIRHLRDDDFFAVDRFPTAEFVCERAEPLPACTPGTPNYTLHGAMKLRGVTQPLSFPAVIAAADADHLTGQAQFELDRTQFGSHYGSGKLFAFLGKHVVNDHIHLHIKLHATRTSA